MELVQLQQQLPGLFQAALATLSSPVITAAVDHYAAFTAYAHSGTADAAALQPSSMLPQLHAVKDSHLAQDTSSDTVQDIDVNDVSTAEASGRDQAAAVDEGDGQGEIQWDIVDEHGEVSAAQQPEGLGDHDSGAAVGADIDWDAVPEATSELAPASQGEPSIGILHKLPLWSKTNKFCMWFVHVYGCCQSLQDVSSAQIQLILASSTCSTECCMLQCVGYSDTLRG